MLAVLLHLPFAPLVTVFRPYANCRDFLWIAGIWLHVLTKVHSSLIIVALAVAPVVAQWGQSTGVRMQVNQLIRHEVRFACACSHAIHVMWVGVLLWVTVRGSLLRDCTVSLGHGCMALWGCC